MEVVHEDIDCIYKAYDLINYHYQEINQQKMAQTVKNKWLPQPELPQQSSYPQKIKAV
jgi:hypothetical protein